jgi:ATP-binding cassette subfamily B multidrug efflux pump
LDWIGYVPQEHVLFSKTVEEKDYVLKNISFTAKQVETVALVGHTGSGKSSIMNVLFSFYDFQKGRYYHMYQTQAASSQRAV